MVPITEAVSADPPIAPIRIMETKVLFSKLFIGISFSIFNNAAEMTPVLYPNNIEHHTDVTTVINKLEGERGGSSVDEERG